MLVGVGMKSCALRINITSDNAVFKLFFKAEEAVITDLITVCSFCILETG